MRDKPPDLPIFKGYTLSGQLATSTLDNLGLLMEMVRGILEEE
jgi:hypothetical protein